MIDNEKTVNLNNNKVKQPFYKVVWFWLFIVFFTITVILAAINIPLSNNLNKKEKEISKMKSGEKTKNDFAKYMRENVVDYDKYVDEYLGISSSSKNEDESTNKNSDFVNSFGTAQGFSNDDTEIEVNVISANIDQSVKLSDDDLSGKPLVLTVSIKNTGSKSYPFNIQEFNVYSKDGNTLNFSSSTYSNTMPSSVNPGQTVQAKGYFVATDDGPFSVTFADGTWK